MNAIARLTPALLIASVAAAAALVALQAPREPAPRADADVVVLPKVEVVHKRTTPTEIVQLPTVHVVAKRQAPQATLVAQKAAGRDAL